MKKYFPGLDVLRFFAVSWVLSFHYFLGYSGVLAFYRYGNLGVQIFFIISGFVIAFSIQEKTLRRFAASRFVRLYPLFWFTCIATFLVTVFIHQQVSLKNFFLSMTMLGQALGVTSFVDAVYWSLTVELFFYGFIALFSHFFSFSKIRLFYWSWFGIVLLFYLFHKDDDVFGKLLLVRHASYFIFGGMLALIVEQIDLKRQPWIWDVAFSGAVAIFATAINARSLPPYFVPNPADHFWVTFINAAMFVVIPLVIFAVRTLPHKINTFVIILGGITYPLYLIHQRIGMIIESKLALYVNSTVAYVLAIVMVLSFSYILYRYDLRFRRHVKTRVPALRE
ncbi:MAG: acyltransferase [Patescibacteria group bacterium]|nr:acyltransferase [Patescibacteria group bacterium]MDE1946227.1 acyltransferase [Patescibacteria group bacterium]